ncbi:FAD binding domain-containing protein [Diaporthe helianthi]|uniref:FAD binding domain-containing protein n=1 Tax=Diaporthe helianthi TaxID=158607 RepID=A0A2P5HXB8_DIAHE|nr:FAD binding domain-containing protein [Diaporthe helianthi]
MESDWVTVSEGRGRREALASSADESTEASHGENALPAEPIEGQSAFWIPRAATDGALLAAWVFARQNDCLKGAQALTFTFLGSRGPGRIHATYLVANMISPMLIWTVEANRGVSRPEKGTLLLIAAVVTQISGIEGTAPMCYLYSMATWDAENLSEEYTIPLEVAQAVLPATLLGYVLPAALMSLVPLTATGISRTFFNIQSSVVYAFISAPVAVPLLTKLVSSVTRQVKRKASGKGDKAAIPRDKRPYPAQDALETVQSLKSAYGVSFAIQATQHLYTIARILIQTPRGQRSFAAVVGNLFTCTAVPRQRFSSLALYSVATLGYGLYTVWELRRRGMVSGRDAKRAAAGVLAGQVFFGPGATYVGLWWWREGVLAKLRQRT